MAEDNNFLATPRQPEAMEQDPGVLSLFSRIQLMSVNEKTRLAVTGDTEARRILIRDPHRDIQTAVLQNPRITSSEIVAIANSRDVHDGVLKQIAADRDWNRLYPVRLALVKNPRTPLAVAIRLVPTLFSQDLKIIARSKAVPRAVAHAARSKMQQHRFR
jgi:hypothetical protein